MDQVNASAGLLIQTFDLPGIGIFLGISSRFVRLFRFVAPAAIVGILLRTVLHLILFNASALACFQAGRHHRLFAVQAMRSSTRVIIHGKNGLEVTRINVSSPTLSVPVSPRSEMVPRLMP